MYVSIGAPVGSTQITVDDRFLHKFTHTPVLGVDVNWNGPCTSCKADKSYSRSLKLKWHSVEQSVLFELAKVLSPQGIHTLAPSSEAKDSPWHGRQDPAPGWEL